ncbi:MAG: hypothetical protein WC458_00210 [Patescibacteria group bacterium]|jgi:hypothetical protein
MNKKSFNAYYQGPVIVVKNSARYKDGEVLISIGEKVGGRIKNVKSVDINELSMDENLRSLIIKTVLNTARKNGLIEKKPIKPIKIAPAHYFPQFGKQMQLT